MKKTKMVIAAWAAIISSGYAGCAKQPDWHNLPEDRPVIGLPTLATDQRNQTIYAPAIAICNRSPHSLKARILIEKGIAEMPYAVRDSTFTVSSGAHYWAGLSHIPRQRKQPIRIKVQWQRGSETGGYTHTIPTDETSTHKGESMQNSQSVRR